MQKVARIILKSPSYIFKDDCTYNAFFNLLFHELRQCYRKLLVRSLYNRSKERLPDNRTNSLITFFIIIERLFDA